MLGCESSRHVDPRAAVSAVPSAGVAASTEVTAPSVSVSVPKPAPSLIPGREACEQCLAAVKAGRFLSEEGSAHFLAGCDVPELRQACLDATRRALPARVTELVRQHRCEDVKTLAEFAARGGVSSPQLVAAVKACTH